MCSDAIVLFKKGRTHPHQERDKEVSLEKTVEVCKSERLSSRKIQVLQKLRELWKIRDSRKFEKMMFRQSARAKQGRKEQHRTVRLYST